MTSGFRIPGPRRNRPYRPPRLFPYGTAVKPKRQSYASVSVSLVPVGHTLIKGEIDSTRLDKFTGLKVRVRYQNSSGKEINSTGVIKGIMGEKLNIQINNKLVRHIPLNKIRIVSLL